ncbi:MAG TPA: hypothetical protein DCX32_01645 [Candidatus Moranbacteria bacterium]|nr:MAG: hypothetical protein UW87_C0028G0003 [Candidatus Moranbacteria bacterium GW2011_GWC2_45_10]KKT94513.1 MAG: hypothetical protein UW95_C0014G0006 [Parcubacteria group bacterium GW2011_GWC1_45_14]HAV11225.1 hypothetical protein [Candidatus Moranbacteria bacterium]
MDKEKKSKTFKEIIEGFLYSDSKKATAAKFALAFLAMGGVVFVGALAPAMFSAMEGTKRYKKYSKRQVQTALNTLKHRKLIEVIREKDGKTRVQLTNKGVKRVKDFCFEELKIREPEQWDGKWRVLMFDIPTRPKVYNNARNALREKVKELGFHQLQKSAWIYPYECEDEILFLAEIYRVEKFIEVLTVETLLHEKELKHKFKL